LRFVEEIEQDTPMLIKRRWHITWSRPESLTTHSLSLSVRSALVLVVALGLFLLTLCCSLGWLLLHRVSDDDMNRLTRENELLRSSVNNVSAQVDSVQARLGLMEDWEERVSRDDNMHLLDDVPMDEQAGGYEFGLEAPVDEADETESGN